jgi:hypothetical protein
MRATVLSLLCAAFCYVVVPLYAQSPPIPSPTVGVSQQTPSPQSPPTQVYRLVAVDQPVQQQYQTVRLVGEPAAAQCQAVQAVQPAVQFVQQPVVQTSYALSQSAQRTVTLGPGPLSLSAAWVGQRLVALGGKTHVWTINHSTIRSQPAAAPPVQTMLVSVAQPVIQQPTTTVQLVSMPAPQPVQQVYRINAPSEQPPPPPVVVPGSSNAPAKPSPQTGSVFGDRRGLFGWSGN